jgi:hypothetical protein
MSGLCVAPLRLGGLRGKESTPSVWLGGTGESSLVGKQEQERQEHKNHLLQALRNNTCHGEAHRPWRLLLRSSCNPAWVFHEIQRGLG